MKLGVKTEYRYFRVTGGKILDAVHEIRDEIKTAASDMKAFVDEFGVAEAYGGEVGIEGVQFKGDNQKKREGWVKFKRRGYTLWKPTVKTPEGKALRQRMRKLRNPGADRFTQLCGYNCFSFLDGLRVRFMGFEQHGNTLVLLVPKIGVADDEATDLADPEQKKAWTPPDDGCTEIKTSEYWQLREANPRKEDAA